MSDAGALLGALYRAVVAAREGAGQPPEPPPLDGSAVTPGSALEALVAACAVVWPGSGWELPGGGARRVVRTVVTSNLAALGGFAETAQAFEQAGVRWVALKGLDHLARLYPGVEWRRMLDFDILVPSAEVTAAAKILEAHGFVAVMPRVPRTQPGFAMSKGRVSVDLHVAVHRRGAFAVNEEWLLADRSEVAVDRVPIRICAAPQAFAAAAMLIAKDGYFPAMVNPVRLVELALLEDLLGAGDHEVVTSVMRRWGASRVLTRSRALTGWVKGGLRPRWAEAGLGEPHVRVELPGLGRRFLRSVELQDTLAQKLTFGLREASVFLAQRATGRRLASWSGRRA